MKATELRIGNYVQTNQGVFKITGIQNEGFLICPFLTNESFSPKKKEIEPIPLTIEWLSKCKNLYQFPFEILGGDKRAFYINCENGSYCQIEYVHQLQNIFFCFVWQELQIIP